jgi:hypothetical protein
VSARQDNDPALGRFAQADSIIPLQTQGVQAWDRYAYVNNNPLRYTDPSGHCIFGLDTAVCIAAAVIGGIILGTTIYNNGIREPSAPASGNASNVVDLMILGYEHAEHATIIGDGLQSL